jgi:RNA polymerase sigma factor FliA
MNNNDLWIDFKKNPGPILRRQIISNYMNLVYYVIHHSKLSPNYILDERDFFQYGIEGLNEAIDRFDPEYGTKFETYAIRRIRGKIIDELRKLQGKMKMGCGENTTLSFQSIVSINNSPDEEEGFILSEVIPNGDDLLGTVVEKNELKNYLMNAIKELNERERLVINLYYFEGLNSREIGEVMNISISRVSQIHTKVIKELKLRMLLYDEYYS